MRFSPTGRQPPKRHPALQNEGRLILQVSHSSTVRPLNVLIDQFFDTSPLVSVRLDAEGMTVPTRPGVRWTPTGLRLSLR